MLQNVEIIQRRDRAYIKSKNMSGEKDVSIIRNDSKGL
jgi:hypothetical protein